MWTGGFDLCYSSHHNICNVERLLFSSIQAAAAAFSAADAALLGN
jgi:hypothetical protein